MFNLSKPSFILKVGVAPFVETKPSSPIIPPNKPIFNFFKSIASSFMPIFPDTLDKVKLS